MTESAIKRYIAIASECEKEKLYADALDYYKKGIDLMNAFYYEIVEKNEKIKYQSKIESYLLRARTIQHVLSQLEPLSMQKHIEIQDGDTGKGYDVIFNPYLDCLVMSIKIYEPYLRNLYQFCHLKQLLELMRTKCKNLKEVYVETSPDMVVINQQNEEFCKISEHLNKHGTKFEVSYSKTIHDRAILLDNGWKIQIGRGIHYFYDGDNDWITGNCNLNMKRCRETRVDIFFNSSLYNGISYFNSALEKPTASSSQKSDNDRVPNHINHEQSNTMVSLFNNLVSSTEKSDAVVNEYLFHNNPLRKKKVLKRCAPNLKKSIVNSKKSGVANSSTSNAGKKHIKTSPANKER